MESGIAFLPVAKKPFSLGAAKRANLMMNGEVIKHGCQIAHLSEIPPTHCLLGHSQRAVIKDQNEVASRPLVEIKQDSELHFDKKMAEMYDVLDGEGHIGLDVQLHPLRPCSAAMIIPSSRHRAVGTDLKILNIPVPEFDPNDEYTV